MLFADAQKAKDNPARVNIFFKITASYHAHHSKRVLLSLYSREHREFFEGETSKWFNSVTYAKPRNTEVDPEKKALAC